MTPSLCLPPQTLESRLKIALPEDLGEALSNGTVLCQLVNQIRPRSVSIIHIPSPAVVSLINPVLSACCRSVGFLLRERSTMFLSLVFWITSGLLKQFRESWEFCEIQCACILQWPQWPLFSII